MTFRNRVSLTLSMLILCQFVWAMDTSERKYQRCFIHFTGQKPLSNEQTLLQIKDKKITAAEACISLIDQAKLNANGVLATKNDLTKSILKKFQSFHRQWFPAYELNIATQDYTMTDFYDVNEMGYHLTYSLLSTDYKFSQIVTSPHSFKGIREASRTPKYFFDDGLAISYERKGKIVWDPGDNSPWTPKLASFGELVGVTKDRGGYNFVKKKAMNAVISHDANKSLGSGILGSLPYILLNSGQNRGTMDGELRVHRGWSKAILKDLLCRDLPVITAEDAKQFVEATSSIAFKQKNECMQCHATIDQMAGVIRNLEIYNTADDGFIKYGIRTVFNHPVLEGPNPYFHQSPEGTVVYRDLRGELHQKKLNNLADLGKWIADNDDFYLCSTKKYFENLTGVEVSLDREALDKNLGPHKFILEEAKALQKHQSLKKLIHNIVASPYF